MSSRRIHLENIHRIDIQTGLTLRTLIVHCARKRVMSQISKSVRPRIADGCALRIDRTLVSTWHADHLRCQHLFALPNQHEYQITPICCYHRSGSKTPFAQEKLCDIPFSTLLAMPPDGPSCHPWTSATGKPDSGAYARSGSDHP